MLIRMMRLLVAVLGGSFALATLAAQPPIAIRQGDIARTRMAYHYPVSRPLAGRSNAGTLSKALRVRHRMITASSSVPINWTFYGPSNVGGRINAILTDPANPQHLIVGSAGGGLFVSNDGGASWSSVGDFLASLAVSSLARGPNGAIYAGTGDQFNEARVGIGILASTDGGVTWNPLPATNATQDTYWQYVNHIAINPNGVMLVAALRLYRSTDGGQTFTVPSYSSNSVFIDDVEFDPNNPNDAVAELGNGTVIYSTDAGKTWSSPVTLVSGGGRISLAFAHDGAHSGWLYALVDNSPGSSASGEIFLSKDDGQTWTQVSQASQTALLCDGSECQGEYDNVIWVDPDDATHLVAGGVDLFQSTDGGATWTMIGLWFDYPVSPHADQHAIVAAPNYSTSGNPLVYVGDDGGIWKADDIRTATPSGGWTELNQGLAVTQFYHVAGHANVSSATNGGIVPVIGGTQDNGTELFDAGSTTPTGWNIIYGGDGGQVAVDPTNGDNLYGEYTYLQLSHSTDGGLSMTSMASPPDAGSGYTAPFIAPFELDPANPNAMFAGGLSLWYGTGLQSGSPTWRNLDGNTFSTANYYLEAIGVSPADDNHVWVGFGDGSLWVTSNALAQTPVWSTVEPTSSTTSPAPFNVPCGQVGLGETTSIDFDPAAPQVMLVSTGLWHCLWRSTDGGQSWTYIGSGLPDVPVYSAAVDPSNQDILYAGTAIGLFVSADGGQTWSTSNEGPANVTVNDIRWFDVANRKMLIATNGRGVWEGQAGEAGVPRVTTIAPTSATAGSSALTLVVLGANFVGSSIVTWNSSNLNTTYVSPGKLTAQVPSSDLAVAGTAQVAVSTPAPGGGTSQTVAFVIDNPIPVVSGLSPASDTAGASGLTLTVNGSGFVSSSVVDWNGSSLSTSFVSSSKLTAQVPASDLKSTGFATVKVASPSPGGGTSGTLTFNISKPPPSSGGGGGASTPVGLLALALLLGLAGLRRYVLQHRG